MSFELIIKCSKDISELNINFADGTNVIQQNIVNKQEKNQSNNSNNKSNDFLDTDSDYGNVSQEVIKPPEIKRDKKTIKVANEMQNLDI